MIVRLTGRVIDGESSREGAYVRVNGPSGDFVSECRTGPDGHFGFNLPPGRWTLIALAPGGRRLLREVDLTPDSGDMTIDLTQPS